MGMSSNPLTLSDSPPTGLSRTTQRVGILVIAAAMIVVLIGYIIIGVRSMQSENVIDARLQAVATRVQTAINRDPATTARGYTSAVRTAVRTTPSLLPVQFVQVDLLDTAVSPPRNDLVTNTLRHRPVLVAAPFLAQLTRSGKAGATTVQSGTDSLRVYVVPLRPPAPVHRAGVVGVIEVFEKVDGTAPSM